MIAPKCVAQLNAAAGKPLSEGKLRAIETELDATMRELARRDKARWRSLTRDQRVAEAAMEAMQRIEADAALKQYRSTLQMLRTAETAERLAQQQRVNKLTQSQALVRDIEQTSQYVDAVRNDSISQLTDLIAAAESKDGTGALRNLGMRVFDLDNPAMTADIVREVFKLADGHTGNKAAQAAAKAWLDTIEGMRVRFNAAGGNVGKLAYGYLSQAHDAVKVFEAGPDAWAQKVLPLLDREQYVKPDGSLMNNAEVLDLLKASHETLATGGKNKVEPGQFMGTGSRANRGSDHRVLHFKDGDAWMQYMDEFGQGSLYDSMMGHVGGMARDIGLVERYGPNPEQQFRVQKDIAERADGAGTRANRGALVVKPESAWNVVSGKAGMAENRLVAQIGQDARNVQTAAKLGGAVLSSFTDVGTIASSLHYNRLPYFDMLRNIGKQMTKENRAWLQEHGVIGEAMVSTLNRWTGDNMTHSLTGRAASAVMKLSLMNAWTDGLRGAFAQTMMGGLARMAKKSWAQLDSWDRYLLERKGITEADWVVISQAKAELDPAGVERLTADAVRSADVEAIIRQQVETVAQFEARLRQEAAATKVAAEQLERELPAVLADIQQRNLPKVDAAELIAQEKRRVSMAKALSTRLENSLGESVSDYAGRIDDLVRLKGEEVKQSVATKVLAFVIDESQFAVVNPDVATRAIVTGGGLPTGTLKGEAMRSFAQFKSFPIAMMTRHWRRIFETPQGLEGAPAGFGGQTPVAGRVNQVAGMAALSVTGMMLGAIVLQNKALVQGKDPYDMSEGKFWMRALTQGGGLGYLGDLIFKDPTEQRGNTVEQTVGTVLGPTAGAAAGLAGDLIVVNAWEAAKGKDTKAAAETLRWVNSQLPGQSLWWSRGVWEHSFLFQAQEAVNPGYLARMKQRAQKDWGQGYWWDPAEMTPDRAPDFARITGD